MLLLWAGTGRVTMPQEATRDGRGVVALQMASFAGAGQQIGRREMSTYEAEQRRQMQVDASAMLLIATDLSVSLGGLRRAEAEGENWRRADAIERLARNVRLRMLGAH